MRAASWVGIRSDTKTPYRRSASVHEKRPGTPCTVYGSSSARTPCSARLIRMSPAHVTSGLLKKASTLRHALSTSSGNVVLDTSSWSSSISMRAVYAPRAAEMCTVTSFSSMASGAPLRSTHRTISFWATFTVRHFIFNIFFYFLFYFFL